MTDPAHPIHPASPRTAPGGSHDQHAVARPGTGPPDRRDPPAAAGPTRPGRPPCSPPAAAAVVGRGGCARGGSGRRRVGRGGGRDDARRPPTAASDGVVANVSVPGRVVTSFADGTWQIGVDVAPGVYTTAGGPTCHHAVRRTRSGGDLVSRAGSPGRGTVVLVEADGWFETSGCPAWRRVG